MGTTSNAARASQLGMPWGTAMHRLRKIIMFDMMTRLGENLCFKCRTRIESVDDLSIEHKQPWLNVSPELFWSLDNLAWSHLKCNTIDRPKGSPGQTWNRKKVSAGNAWCWLGQHELPLSAFSVNRSRFNGREETCKECRSRYRSQ